LIVLYTLKDCLYEQNIQLAGRQTSWSSRETYWNEHRGEVEFEAPARRRRWRWPYRLHPGLPLWVREALRQTVFWGSDRVALPRLARIQLIGELA